MIGRRRQQKRKRKDFEAVALPHLDELYRTACRMLGDASRAEDVVQEVYLRAWRSFHTFDGGNCRAWLFRILVNAVHDYRRRLYKRMPADDSEAVLERQSAPAPPPPEELTDQAVLEAVDALPEKFRDVLLLADVHGFSYKEIAAMTGVRLGTVMSRLSRGRRKLRESLAEVAGSYGIGPRARGGGVA